MNRPSVSCVVTLSKPECVPLVKRNLLNLEGEVDELILMVDGSFVLETDDLKEKYPEIKLHRMSDRPKSKHINKLRDRIAEVRNQSCELIGDTEFVFSFEDDTEVPKDALVKFLSKASEKTKYHGTGIEAPSYFASCLGIISGIQIGRHSRKLIGAWSADDYIFPTEVTSMSKQDGLVEVDGTGFFCFLTATHYYKSIKFGWKEPVGPDVWYGLRLREQGHKNYVDTSIVCPHHVGNLKLVPDENTVRARFYKDKTGRWSHELIPH